MVIKIKPINLDLDTLLKTKKVKGVDVIQGVPIMVDCRVVVDEGMVPIIHGIFINTIRIPTKLKNFDL